MKETVMKKKEPCSTAHVPLIDRLFVNAQAGFIRIWNAEEIEKIEQANQHALQPIDPYNGVELAGLLKIIVNKVSVHKQQEPKPGVFESTLYQAGDFLLN